MINNAPENLDERGKALLKETPCDRRQMLRDEIGLLRARERRLMRDLNRLGSSAKMIRAVVKSGGSPMDMVLRAHGGAYRHICADDPGHRSPAPDGGRRGPP